jgi:nucleoid-associated protein YgaU
MVKVLAGSAARRLRFPMCMLWVLLSGCAAHIPPEDFSVTETVLQEALNAEATIYAPDEYARAQESLYLSKQAIDKHQYKKAQELLDNAERDARIALTKAQAGKTIKQARDRLFGSDLGQLKKYITDVCAIAEKSLNQAESDYESQRYDLARENAELSLQLSQELPKLLEQKMLEEQNTGVNPAEMQKVSKQAQRLLENAQLEAANIIADAKRKADAITSRALERQYPSSYTVKDGDKLQIIAARKEIYNDLYQWPLIYKANRDQIRDPQILFVGQQLVIPRKVTIEEVREARRQAGAEAPYDPPPDGFHPSDYQ